MAHAKKVTQGHLEEQRKAAKRSKKQDVAGGTPVHQIVQRLVDNEAGAIDPESIKDLQQTVGNRAVSKVVDRMNTTSGGGDIPAVQRTGVYSASNVNDDLMGGSPDTARIPTVGTTPPAPTPYPNLAEASQTPKTSGKVGFKNKPLAIKSSKVGSSMGDETGTTRGIPSPNNTSPNQPPGGVVTVGQSKVIVDPPSNTSTQTPGAGEQEATTPAPAPSPPVEETESS